MRLPLRFLLALVPLAAAAPAQATIALQLDLPALTAQADLVVRGRVVSGKSRWDAARRRIYTDVVVHVDEAYKGDVRRGQPLVVTRLGGSVDGVGMRVSGEVSLAAGEEAILFLRRHTGARAARLSVVGMAQGKLAVLRDRRGARVLPVVGAAGLTLVATAKGGRLRSTGARPAVRPLAEVEREIRALATARRPAPARPGVRR